MKNIDNLKSVKALKLIKYCMSILGYEQFPFIEDSKTQYFIICDELHLHIDIVEYKNRYIMKLEEIAVSKTNDSLGSLVMNIIVKACSLYSVPIGLFVNSDNTIAISWYKNIGFKNKDRKSKDLWLEKQPNHNTNYFENKLDKALFYKIDELIHSKLQLDTLVEYNDNLIELVNVEREINFLESIKNNIVNDK